MRRLTEAYVWQHIDEAEYKTQRADLERKLLELPAPVDSNIIAFDRAAERLLPIGTILRETTPEHQGAPIRHIVEKVTIRDGDVVEIAVRAEARPFYSSSAEAPPESLGNSGDTQDRLAWYASRGHSPTS